LERALAELLRHHDALRLRFQRGASGIEQICAGELEEPRCDRIDLAGLEPAARNERLQAAAAELHAGMDLERGPLTRLLLFELGAGASRLLWVIHHLAVDAVSWRILLEDLQAAYQQLEAGRPARLPPKTTSFASWARLLQQRADSAEAAATAPRWLQALRAGAPLPFDAPADDPLGLVGDARIVRVELGTTETETLLREAPRARQAQVQELLLTAVATAITDWSGAARLLIDLEGHGREDLFEQVDVSRTVGWFTTLAPLALTVEERHRRDPLAALEQIKRELRDLPDHGIDFGLLRYLASDGRFADQVRALAEPQLNFNYLGQLDQLAPDPTFLTPVFEPCGPDRSPRARRRHLLEIVAWVAHGRLQIEWTYSPSAHRRPTIEQLAGAALEALRKLVIGAGERSSTGYRAADFPESGLSQAELDQLLQELDHGGA
jgi:non-ribosomal peptide synthase protein (TIGR01720 family)